MQLIKSIKKETRLERELRRFLHSIDKRGFI